MGFAHLVNIDATVEAFKAKYNIPWDVFIEYCIEGNIEDQRVPRAIFIPLMAILEGGVRFPLDPLLLGTLGFMGSALTSVYSTFIGWSAAIAG